MGIFHCYDSLPKGMNKNIEQLAASREKNISYPPPGIQDNQLKGCHHKIKTIVSLKAATFQVLFIFDFNFL